MTQVLHITPAAVAGPGTVAGVGQRTPLGGRQETQVLGGGIDPLFRDVAPPKGLLTGLEVGLGKWADNDVVTAVRPIFTTAAGEEILGQQHGADTSHVTRVTAKPGYAVGGLTAKAAAVVNGFSVTFMKIDGDRLDSKQTYQSDWIGGRNGGQESRLGGDGAAVVGIVGRANSRDCTGLGLVLHLAAPPATSPPVVATPLHGRRANAPPQAAPTPGGNGVAESGGDFHFPRGVPPAPPAAVALDAERVTRSLPEPADDVAAGGNGRYLFLHLPKLRKLAVFDVQQAKIASYLPMSSDNLLFAAGAEKLIVILRDQGVVQRYDLATQKKELSVTLPEAGQAECMALGYASAGPALLMTDNGPRFLDLAKLSLVEIRNNRLGRYWWGRRIQVRASADGGTFAGWGNNGSPSGLFFWNIDGDAMRDHYEHVSAGCASPSYDGKLVFTGAGGIYSADLRRQTFEQLHDATYLPACHPAYFMGFSGVNRLGTRGRPENLKPKLLAVYHRRQAAAAFLQRPRRDQRRAGIALRPRRRLEHRQADPLLPHGQPAGGPHGVPRSARAPQARPGGGHGEGGHRLPLCDLDPARHGLARQHAGLPGRSQVAAGRRPLHAGQRPGGHDRLRRRQTRVEGARRAVQRPPGGDHHHQGRQRAGDHAHIQPRGPLVPCQLLIDG